MVAGQRRWGKMAAVYYVVTMLQMASSSLFVSATQGLVLSERIMFLSKTAADLSALAYKDNPPGNGYDFFVPLANEPNVGCHTSQYSGVLGRLAEMRSTSSSRGTASIRSGDAQKSVRMLSLT